MGLSTHGAPEVRFRDGIRSVTESGCWEWGGGLDRNGYGKFYRGGVRTGVHRYAWESKNGPIPKGMHVMHKCDNRCCVNPDHLTIGTHRQNVADMVKKGRQCIGTRHGQAKLTVDQVVAIRSDPRIHKVIAEEYGVNRTTICMIKSGRRWAKVVQGA